MSDFINIGNSAIRKEDIVGFFFKEQDGKSIIEIWLNKLKCQDSILTFTPNSPEDYDWMVNYILMSLGLDYNAEILTND